MSGVTVREKGIVMSKHPNINRFLRPPQAAKHLGISLEELNKLHQLKRVQKLDAVYFEIKDLNHYLRKQRASIVKLIGNAPKRVSVMELICSVGET